MEPGALPCQDGVLLERWEGEDIDGRHCPRVSMRTLDSVDPEAGDAATEANSQAISKPFGGDLVHRARQPLPEGMSRSEARRLRKEEWRESRRELNKEKKRDKKKRTKLNRAEVRKERLAAMTEEERASFLEKAKAEGLARKEMDVAHMNWALESGAPKVVVNCSFADAMNPRDWTSLAKQAQLSYTWVRDLRSPLQLHLTSLDGANPAIHSLESIGFRKWQLHIHEQSCWEVFDKSTMVVLSPDADQDLDTVSEDCVYVIGGLVDRVVSKFESKKQADSHKVDCLRRIPIKKFGPFGTNPVLNIDTVVRILAERLKRPGPEDWTAILAECIPMRRQNPSGRAVERNARRAERKNAGGQVTSPEGDDDSGSSSSDSESADDASSDGRSENLEASKLGSG